MATDCNSLKCRFRDLRYRFDVLPDLIADKYVNVQLTAPVLYISTASATHAGNKDIAAYEHRVSHRIQGSSTFLFRF